MRRCAVWRGECSLRKSRASRNDVTGKMMEPPEVSKENRYAVSVSRDGSLVADDAVF